MTTGLINFQEINADKHWAFNECTQKQTRYLTHSYHTYPAKFIPQLAAKLIKELSQKNEIVVDPFMGSGTTVVEALLQERLSVGVDINPIATLIAKVKSTPLEPVILKQTYNELTEKLLTHSKLTPLIPQHERLDYWFPQPQQEQLGAILNQIYQITPVEIKDFFLVAFSQILKSCSIWLQKSVKPCRDTHKVLPEPINTFLRHARYMMKKIPNSTMGYC
jgi:transposase